MNGKVYLVGAGPGDPGLITVKGAECIRRADVIIYDYLASPALLRFAADDAQTIYVGKKGGDHTLSQDGINNLIVEKAMSGAIVTRLKGGDPFIFGRGGEEAEILADRGIPFEIVPGVTSAIAAPAYAGIPLTHRQFTSTLAFVTGHEDPTKESSDIDWASLAKGIGTIVFFMGVKNLPRIVEKLLGAGMPEDRPVALIRWGTTSRQKTVSGCLGDIVEKVRLSGLKAPAIIVVGEVVRLREQLRWFENRPLLGKRIVVTRARKQASELVHMLGENGAECLEIPTIRIAPPESFQDIDQAIAHLSDYDWIVFTSVNGVDMFFQRLSAQHLDARALAGLRTAVIGPATEKRLAAFGLRSDIVPESYRAESVVEAFRGTDVKGKRVLLPRAAEARPVLPVELRKMEAVVDEITVYQTRMVEGQREKLLKLLEDRLVDVVTFTSSSTVRNFMHLIPEDKKEFLLNGVQVASIGPITSETANELGLTVHIEANTYTVAGLGDAILQYYASGQTG
jgi:uroporphyrinogen III methyltransferase/synthase